MEKVAAGVLASSFLFPMLAFAQESTTTVPATRDVKTFCANVETQRTKAIGRVTDRVKTIEGKKSDRKTKFAAGRTERHDKLAAARATHDTERQTHYAKLMTRASTTEQKAAVTAFQTEVERLVTVRKAAVDAAIKSFEDGVAALQDSNDTAVTTFSTTMQADINKIFDDATASCTAGKKGPEVRAQVQAALEAKRAARATEPKVLAIHDQLVALQTTRKAAVDAAIAAFKTDMDAATATLKKAFTK